jgi:uncharacterized membrane protein YcaP (DUF421 family)
MLFDTWFGLVRIVVVGTAAYAALVLILRVSGKRTLAKLNAFDLVVTVALGSTLATVLLSKSVALADGLLGFALLVGLRYAVAWVSVRSPRLGAVVKSEPSLLLHRGRFLEGAMRRQRVAQEEVVSPRCGHPAWHGPRTTAAVVLETDGSLSVIRTAGDGAARRSSLPPGLLSSSGTGSPLSAHRGDRRGSSLSHERSQ